MGGIDNVAFASIVMAGLTMAIGSIGPAIGEGLGYIEGIKCDSAASRMKLAQLRGHCSLVLR